MLPLPPRSNPYRTELSECSATRTAAQGRRAKLGRAGHKNLYLPNPPFGGCLSTRSPNTIEGTCFLTLEAAMRKVIVSEFVSLDGVMEDSGREMTAWTDR